MKTQFLKNMAMAVIAFIAAYLSEPHDVINWGYVGITCLGIVITYFGKNYFVKSVSIFGTIDIRDLLSGAIIAIGAAVSSFAASVLTTGVIDWKGLLVAAGTAISGYILKTLSSNSKGNILKKE